jgi:hypothetical protein
VTETEAKIGSQKDGRQRTAYDTETLHRPTAHADGQATAPTRSYGRHIAANSMRKEVIRTTKRRTSHISKASDKLRKYTNSKDLRCSDAEVGRRIPAKLNETKEKSQQRNE